LKLDEFAMRWFLFLLLGALGWLLWKAWSRAKYRSTRAKQETKNDPSLPDQDPQTGQSAHKGPNEQHAQTMVRCAHCGAWSPQSMALSQGGQWFCDESHAKAKS